MPSTGRPSNRLPGPRLLPPAPPPLALPRENRPCHTVGGSLCVVLLPTYTSCFSPPPPTPPTTAWRVLSACVPPTIPPPPPLAPPPRPAVRWPRPPTSKQTHTHTRRGPSGCLRRGQQLSTVDSTCRPCYVDLVHIEVL